MLKLKDVFPLSSFFICIIAYAEAEQHIVLMNLWINGVDRQTDSLMFVEDGKNYVECNVLEHLGIKKDALKNRSDKKEFCLVSGNEFSSEKDDGLQAIKINAPGHFFNDQNFGSQVLMPVKANFGGFLNYNTFYNQDNSSHQFNAMTELGVFKDYWMFKNGLFYKEKASDDHLIRLDTSLSFEFPNHFSRLVIGDTITTFNTQLSSFRFGGLSFGTNFTERPDFIYWNVPALNGSATLPSTVDLYINGVQLYRQKVLPGNYSIQSGASIQQGGTAQIVVEDILGNRTVQSFPVYINNRLLKPKLDEYNISLGKIRYNYSDQNDDYREFFSSIYYRRGLTDKTTLGTTLSYSEEAKNYSFLWTQALSRFGLLDYSYTLSQYKGQNGYNMNTSLSNQIGRYSFGISNQYYSQDFRRLGDLSSQRVKSDTLVYIGLYEIPYFNNMYLNYVERDYYPNQNFNVLKNRILNLSFSKIVNKQFSYNVGYYKDLENNANSGFLLSMNYYFDKGRSISASRNNSEINRMSYVKNSNYQTGLDYGIGVTNRDSDFSYSGYGVYKSNYGDLRVSHDRNDRFHNTQASYEGALVWLGKHVAATKYVDNAFAVVNVGDYKDIDIYRTSSLVGKTNDKGYMFVHNIIPYVNYDISFNQNQLPLDEKVDVEKKRIITLNQRGYYVDFPVYHTQMAIVRLHDAENHHFERATEVYVGDDPEYYPIDGEAKVYLYGLKQDKYDLLIKMPGNKSCHASLDLRSRPASDVKQVIDLLCQ